VLWCRASTSRPLKDSAQEDEALPGHLLLMAVRVAETKASQLPHRHQHERGGGQTIFHLHVHVGWRRSMRMAAGLIRKGG